MLCKPHPLTHAATKYTKKLLREINVVLLLELQCSNTEKARSADTKGMLLLLNVVNMIMWFPSSLQNEVVLINPSQLLFDS